MIRNGYEAAATLGSSYLVLDRYFLTVPALTELEKLNQTAPLVDAITRAKNSCTAYEIPEVDSVTISGQKPCQSSISIERTYSNETE